MKNVEFKLKIFETFRKINKSLNILISGESFEKMALLRGVGSAREHFTVLKGLSDVDFIVDVGANRGQFLLCACAAIPEVTAVSFEPLAEPFNRLNKIINLLPNSCHVEAVNCAVGSVAGSSQINVSKRDDSSSLLNITSKQTNIFKGTDCSHKESITVSTLDSKFHNKLIPIGTLLKLDVQGFELEALKGAEKVLSRIKYVYVECSFEELYQGQALAPEVIAFLSNLDFRLIGIFNPFYIRNGQNCVQADFLFSKH